MIECDNMDTKIELIGYADVSYNNKTDMVTIKNKRNQLQVKVSFGTILKLQDAIKFENL